MDGFGAWTLKTTMCPCIHTRGLEGELAAHDHGRIAIKQGGNSCRLMEIRTLGCPRTTVHYFSSMNGLASMCYVHVYIYIPILETRSWNHLGRHVWNSLGFTELILAPWASQSIPRSQTQPKVSSWSRRTTVAARKRLMDEMSKVDPLPDTNGW